MFILSDQYGPTGFINSIIVSKNQSTGLMNLYTTKLVFRLKKSEKIEVSTIMSSSRAALAVCLLNLQYFREVDLFRTNLDKCLLLF